MQKNTLPIAYMIHAQRIPEAIFIRGKAFEFEYLGEIETEYKIRHAPVVLYGVDSWKKNRGRKSRSIAALRY